MELGIYSFVERTPAPQTGQLVSAEECLADLIEEIVLADQVGLDVFGVGDTRRAERAAINGIARM